MTGTAQHRYKKYKLRPYAKTNMTTICAASLSVKTFEVSEIHHRARQIKKAPYMMCAAVFLSLSNSLFVPPLFNFPVT